MTAGEPAPELPAWKLGISGVGLVTVNHRDQLGVMAAEWSYFVNKDPLWVAVVLSPRSATRTRLGEVSEFGLTLCSDTQAALADFVGSFSAADVVKSGSDSISFRTPEVISTPLVDGGVVALECRLRQRIELPVHQMMLAEVVAEHRGTASASPLVKHGPMYHLGPPIQRRHIVTAAELVEPGLLRVAATGPASPVPWQAVLITADGRKFELTGESDTSWQDLLLDAELPAELAADQLGDARVEVYRGDAVMGSSTVSRRERSG